MHTGGSSCRQRRRAAALVDNGELIRADRPERLYTAEKKRTSSTIVVDQLELLNIDESGNYGTTWTTRPPCYIAHVTDSQLPAQTIIHSFHPESRSAVKTEIAGMKFATYSPAIIYKSKSSLNKHRTMGDDEQDLEND